MSSSGGWRRLSTELRRECFRIQTQLSQLNGMIAEVDLIRKPGLSLRDQLFFAAALKFADDRLAEGDADLGTWNQGPCQCRKNSCATNEVSKIRSAGIKLGSAAVALLSNIPCPFR